MNHTAEPTAHVTQAVDAYALRITGRLTQGTADLPYDITERLRAARMQALGKRRKPAAQFVRQAAPATLVTSHGRTAALGGWGGEGGNWWRTLVSAVPLTALAVGLVFINMAQDESVASEIAEVDAALLTDDLPPSAYADPGFVQFLKSTHQNP